MTSHTYKHHWRVIGNCYPASKVHWNATAAKFLDIVSFTNICGTTPSLFPDAVMMNVKDLRTALTCANALLSPQVSLHKNLFHIANILGWLEIQIHLIARLQKNRAHHSFAAWAALKTVCQKWRSCWTQESQIFGTRRSLLVQNQIISDTGMIYLSGKWSIYLSVRELCTKIAKLYE